MKHQIDWKKTNIVDYLGNNKFIELTSRNNNNNKYPTTMIDYNKIIKVFTLNKDVYLFLFVLLFVLF